MCRPQGGDISGGIAHAATDDINFHAVKDRHDVTDLTATVLHQRKLDACRLDILGQQRLVLDFGMPIQAVLSAWAILANCHNSCGTVITVVRVVPIRLLPQP